MKLLLILIVIVFFHINTYSYENIKWVKSELPELPSNDPLRNIFTIANSTFLDVMFLESNPNYGWVSGFNSLVLRTVDGGKNWDYTIVDRNNQYQLESVFFLNENVGYASGPCNSCYNLDGGVFKSTDGGITWKEITPIFSYQSILGIKHSLPLWGCFFENELEGYVVGGDCGTEYPITNFSNFQQVIYKTKDGGENWELIPFSEGFTKMADIITDEDGFSWVISSGRLWKSNIEKTNWTIVSETGEVDWHEDISKYNNSFIVPYSVGCAGNNNVDGGLRITTDGGNTWRDTVTEGAMYGSLMVDDLTGWGVGYNASVYQTTDGGYNWKNINACLDGGDFLDDIALASDGRYWIVGDDIWHSAPAIFDTLTRQQEIINICKGEKIILDLDTNINNIYWNVNSFSSTFEYEANSSKTITAMYYNEECADTVYHSIFEINVLPLPDYQITFSNKQPCVGEEVLVSVNPLYSNYKWENMTDSTILNTTGNSATITKSGTYKVSIVDEFLCEHSYEFPVEFKPLPILNIDSIGRINFCLGDTLLLIAKHNGTSVEWYEENNENSISNQDTLIVLNSGTFHAIVTSEYGCTISSDIINAKARIDTNNFKLNYEFDGNWFEDDIVVKGDYVCNKLIIRNHRDFDAVIDNPIVLGNTEFSIPSYQLPLTIPANSQAELEVCFLGIGEQIRLDTILIADRCSDHYLPLKAIVKDKVELTESKCFLSIKLIDVSLMDEYFITLGVPYPNPTQNISKLEYIEFIPNDFQFTIDVALYDLFGIRIKELNYNIVESDIQKNGKLVKSIIDIDMTDQNSGVYLIQIVNPNSTDYFKIIKI